MATTALELNPESIPLGRNQSEVQELTNVIAEHASRFRRIALAHLGDAADAEDAVQDALLSALTHVDQFRGQAKMSTWLTSIVINSARMKLRQRSTRLHLALDQTNDQNFTLGEMLSDTRPGPEETYRNQEIAETLAHATSRLSPALLRTFQLRDLYGLSIRETAHLMGVPPGTVKARLARARMKLKELISKKSGNVRGKQSVPETQKPLTQTA
ncbi:MAG: sigma-70 family RNA polymerase sigma factor [Candidatus Sulfotelmatobacter sp.]